MGVETPADRAAMFNVAEFGTAATYTPPGGGAAEGCTIVLDLGRREDFEAESGRGAARGAIATKRAMLLADQIASPVKGGTIVAGGKSYRIASTPEEDETGAIWTADLTELP